MTIAVTFPSAERSGAHRIALLEVGDLRGVIATVAGFATMTRAPSIGPRVLREMLPELRVAVCGAEPAVLRALVGACEALGLGTGLLAEAQLAVAELAKATRHAVRGIELAIDEAEPLGARSRLRLQAACQAAVDELLGVRSACELLQQASTCEPLPIAVEDLFEELAGAANGPEVRLELQGTPGSAPLVAVAPAVVGPLLLRALSWGVACGPARHFVLTVEPGAEPSAVVLQLRPAVGRPVPGGARRRDPRAPRPPAVAVRVPPTRAYDPAVFALAAGALAASIQLDPDGSSSLTLLAASPGGP